MKTQLRDLFIIESLKKIFNEFKSELDNLEDLCELKELRFDGKAPPNYEKGIVQQYYLLRYFYIYVAEYNYIYDRILKLRFLDPSELKIFSIGAGCGLDFYGLYFSLKAINQKLRCTNYYGIDKVEWCSRDLMFIEPNIDHNDVTSLNVIDNFINVLMFPKSISEFDKPNFIKLKEIIRNSHIKNDRMIIVSSIRDRNVSDADRVLEIVKIFLDRGFTNIDETSNKFQNCLPRFAQHPVTISYPTNIETFLKDLVKYCMDKKKKSCNQSCKAVFDKNPMKCFDYMTFQIYRLEKK